MRSLFEKFFLANWQRKVISLILAIIIWLLVNNSLISERTYSNIPIRIRNIPKGMVIPSLDSRGFLEEKVTLKIVGYKKVLEQLTAEDIQVILDADTKDRDWVAIIRKNEVLFMNSFINPHPYIRSIEHDPFVVPMTKLD